MEQSCREKVTKGFLRIIPRGKENEPTNTRETLKHVTSVRDVCSTLWSIQTVSSCVTTWIKTSKELTGTQNAVNLSKARNAGTLKQQTRSRKIQSPLPERAISYWWKLIYPKRPNTAQVLCWVCASSTPTNANTCLSKVFCVFSFTRGGATVVSGKHCQKHTGGYRYWLSTVSIRGFSFSCFLLKERNKLVTWYHGTREQSAYSSKLRKWKTVQRSYLSWGNMQSLTLGSGLVLCLHCTSAMAARVPALTYNFMQILGQKTSCILWFHFVHHNKTHSNLLMMLIFTS